MPQEGSSATPVVIREATDRNGAFRLKGGIGGRYRLKVRHPAYFEGAYGSSAPNAAGTVVLLEPGQHVKGLQIALVRPSAVGGRVLNELGDPLSGVNVNVLVQRRRQGRVYWAPASTSAIARTNDRGEYRAFGLDPGKYAVMAAMLKYGAADSDESDGKEAYGAIFYQNEKDLSRVLDIHAGADLAGIDLLMQKAKVFRVAGRVALPSEQEFKSASLLLWPSSTPFIRSGVPVRPDGTFELRNLESGSYMLIAMLEVDGRRWTTRSTLDVTDRDIQDFVIVPQRNHQVAGKVVMEGGGQADLSAVTVALRAVEDNAPFPVVSAKAGKNGVFALEDVGGQVYRVHVVAPDEHLYRKAAKFDGSDVMDKEFPVAGPSNLEVALSAEAGSVEGEVRNDEAPVAGALVALVPKGERRKIPEYYRFASTDLSGRFRIAGLAPGEFVLFAFDGVDSEECYDPEFLKQYERKATEVAVSAGGAKQVSLPVLGAK